MDQQPRHSRCGKAAHGARNAQKWMERGKHQKAGWAADRGQVVKLSEENTTRIDDVMQRLNVATKQLQRVLQSNGEKGIEEQEIVDACEKGEELCGSLSEFVVL